MSQEFDAAVEKLRERASAEPVDGSFKFDIENEGVILLQDGTVSTDDGAADVTIKADMDTFREIFEGQLSPTAAFMTGRIEVEGDVQSAMKLSTLLG